ncbi:type VI secretion protein, partial [Escherichia coli]
MLKITLIAALLIAPFSCLAVVTPRSSSYDSHMQNVAYNSQNSTIVNARVGYVSTLIFDDDEDVIEAEAGFENGWIIKKSANRVKIRPAPITQPVTSPDGTTVKQVFLPTAKDWKTNLFVTTTKNRHYSVVLNVIDDDKPIDNLAFVVQYSYPADVRQLSDDAKLARERELQEQREKALIATAFKTATAP